MRGHKRDQGYYGRGENGSDNRQPPPHSANEVWTEHVSSSGKKYYYNNLCGISQWDKPSDWIDPPPRRHYSGGNRDRDDESEHSHRRYRDNHNYYSESSYRDQHNDMRSSRNQHYNYNDVHGSHEIDTSSGGSTPVQDVRLRPNQDNQPPLTMASALPRNLSHQSSAAISHQMSTVNSYMPNDNVNRHTSLNVLLKSKMDGIQNVGTYGNFSGSEAPMLTPSLSKYVSNDLVKHVSNWPADVLERQAQKYSDESYILGNLQCMRVCSDLKCARALVRHMEIKATLQDQKLEYIRQLIDKIKDIKPKNAIMSDET